MLPTLRPGRPRRWREREQAPAVGPTAERVCDVRRWQPFIESWHYEHSVDVKSLRLLDLEMLAGTVRRR